MKKRYQYLQRFYELLAILHVEITRVRYRLIQLRIYRCRS